MSRFTFHPIGSGSWADIESLFGSRGACGGCWCMYWRQKKGEPWENTKGEVNRRRFQRLVVAGEAKGVLAFDGADPVGWAAVGPRPSFDRLERSPSLRCDDAHEVWALPCFFVKSGYRRRGIARGLLRESLRLIKACRGKIAEGYPVQPPRKGEAIPAAFAWTGTVPLFAQAGFVATDSKKTGKLRMRKKLR